MSSSRKGKVARFHFSVIYLIIVSVWVFPKHPEWKPPAAASSSDLPVWLICLIARSVFLAITQFPSLVCKTALSSGGGIWQQQIQSPGSLRWPDLALLLGPVIKASCCLLLWSHQKHCREFLPPEREIREQPLRHPRLSDFNSTQEGRILFKHVFLFL